MEKGQEEGGQKGWTVKRYDKISLNYLNQYKSSCLFLLLMNQSQENSQRTDSDQLSELKKEISLHSGLLVDIVSDDDKFIQKLKDLNQSGVACILKENYHESLVYLQEAEKVLQFAANCGKTIDRVIIIYTLQNVACTYQKLWELEKASSYLEAIIYNMNAYIDCVPDNVMPSQIFNSFSQSYNNLSTFVNKRLNIVMYYLKFSAINSQMKKHQIALNSATKALQVLKIVCEQCYNYERYVQKAEPSHEVRIMLKELSCVKENVDLQLTDKYFKLAQKGLLKLRQRKYTNLNTKQIEELETFSIGDVMQIIPISMSNLEKIATLEEQVTYLQKLHKALDISICYFAIATQLRLLCEDKYSEQEKKKSSQYMKSQLFHLNSIIIACKYLPQQNNYLEHILKSFMNHYQIDLEEDEIQSSKEEEIQLDDSENLIVNVERNTKIFVNQLEEQSKVLKIQKNQSTKTTQKSSDPLKTPIIGEIERKKKEKKKDKSKSKCKSIQRIQNPILIKHNYFHTLKRRKSSIHKSKEKLKMKISPINNFSQKALKEKSREKYQKVKSRDKNKSTSKKQISIQKKQKSTDKKKKKSNKLQEEYFMKINTKKKVGTPKPMNVSNTKVSDYMSTSTSKVILKSVSKTPTNKMQKG